MQMFIIQLLQKQVNIITQKIIKIEQKTFDCSSFHSLEENNVLSMF
jgi:hypothetical protein